MGGIDDEIDALDDTDNLGDNGPEDLVGDVIT
jgi:hypothetical protein